jgi:hypothetical protein
MEKLDEWILNDKYAPITNSFGFIEGGIEEIVEKFLNWRRIIKTLNPQCLSIDEKKVSENSLGEIIHHLTPLNYGEANRYLFIPTKSNWVAYFDNCYKGTDNGVIYHFPTLTQKRGIIFHRTIFSQKKIDNKWVGDIGSLGFSIYQPQDGISRVRRYVNLMKDMGKWSFEQYGEPLLIENIEKYHERQKSQRFSTSDLIRILNYFDIDLLSDNFFLQGFSNPSHLVTITYSYDMEIRKLSLSEAKNINYLGP